MCWAARTTYFPNSTKIAKGGLVSVTHPEITRFFMSNPEAAQLVLQASSVGRGGEIFTLDLGEPVRIVDLARNLIRLYGFWKSKSGLCSRFAAGREVI